MQRSVIFALFAFLGFLMAFAMQLPTARSAQPPVAVAAADQLGEVPLHWISRALSEMPFIIPPGR
jgi:hypothetical protein